MISQKIQDAFNEQINAEYFSSILYLSMSAWLEGQGFKGMASWMRMQADEERFHALKFLDYIHERGGTVALAPIDGPRKEWGSPLEVFTESCEHEAKVTGLINKLMDLAIAENDHASKGFLQWFVDEQVEEEASVQEITDRLKMAGEHGGVMFMLDRELGQRQPPAPGAEH